MFKYSLESIMTQQSNDQKKGWIGCDLDGTAAIYDGWKGWDHIGDPIPWMKDRIKKHLEDGYDVRILTARCSKVSLARNNITFEQMEKVIQDWTEKHFGVRLPVTSEKDCYMQFFYDDSCVQVHTNTGIIIGEQIAPRLNTEEDYNAPIKEMDEGDISGDFQWNEKKVGWIQWSDFKDGLKHGGFQHVSTPRERCKDCQCMCDCSTTDATKNYHACRFAANTRKGFPKGEVNYHDYFVIDVRVANGSQRFVFDEKDLNFRSLGCWFAKRIITGG